MPFTRMDQGKVEDWMIIGQAVAQRQAAMPQMVRKMLGQLEEQVDGFAVNQLEDSLQSKRLPPIVSALRQTEIYFVGAAGGGDDARTEAPLPFTPGAEVAGIVDAVGPGVDQPALRTVRKTWRNCSTGCPSPLPKMQWRNPRRLKRQLQAWRAKRARKDTPEP